MVEDSDLTKHWNKVLSRSGLGLIEKQNRIFPETITMDYELMDRRTKANAWLQTFSEGKLEKCRYGERRGLPNLSHKRIIELFVEGQSTREIAKELHKQGEQMGFQGVARVLRRYLEAA